ncbi:hypothetical protein GCM10020227_01920 [Streptomyces flavovirens]
MDVADETGVHQGDTLVGGDRGEQLGGLAGVGGGGHVEAERPQIVLERRSGYRRTGEDGGRQTNSLLGGERERRATVRPCGRAGGSSAESLPGDLRPKDGRRSGTCGSKAPERPRSGATRAFRQRGKRTYQGVAARSEITDRL